MNSTNIDYAMMFAVAFLITAVQLVPAIAGQVEAERGVRAGESGLKVAVSLSDFNNILKEISGPYVELVEIMPPGSDPHSYSLTNDVLQSLANADLIVLANSDLLSFEQNIKSNYPDKEYLDFPDYQAEGASLDDYPGYESCEHGYWFKFDNARAIALAYEKKISSMDPDNAAYYQANYDDFSSRIDQIKKDISDSNEMNGLKGVTLVAAVPGVNYIISNMGMSVGAVLMREGSGFVSGSALTEIEARLSDGTYGGIVCPDSMKDAKAGEISEQLSRDTGAPVIYVHFLATSSGDFFSMSYYNAMQLSYGTAAGNVKAGASGEGNDMIYIYALVAMVVIALLEGVVIYRMRGEDEEADYQLFEKKGGDREG